ncbi:iron-containing alcohol dehydrogenase [Salidesulfovibrio brasiliensis]|uniref:iron-containing alcohol dehydrogenase n=1 Tax=Salidesulfovibrio brasiliensis TaxID=221711 RepID=UPI0006CF2413|nr:iron-containing alcohol dehydrogenase [Salidesulfovibrio brasiliensis]
MENFVFSIPTVAYFGKGQIESLGSAIRRFGGSKVLLAYGGGSIKRNGVYDDVVKQLDAAGLPYAELSGIQPNPRLKSVEEGVALYRESGCDFILGVGGGSTLDACKAIAAAAGYEGEVMDLLDGTAEVSGAAPLGTVLTMAGTGSEMDSGGVITVGEDHKKHVIFHQELYPKFSILDPEYTFTVPQWHSMAGAVDILSHLMEQYFTPDCGTEVQDRMNEGLMKAVIDNTPKVLENPEDYDARANVMWASSMALAGFQFRLGKPMFPFPVHYIGHELSSLNDMTHGVSLALVTPAWMRHTMRKNPESTPVFAQFARNVFDVREADDAKAAEQGVVLLERFFASVKMPANLREADVPEDKLEYLAEKAVEHGELGILAKLDRDDVLRILKDAY